MLMEACTIVPHHVNARLRPPTGVRSAGKGKRPSSGLLSVRTDFHPLRRTKNATRGRLVVQSFFDLDDDDGDRSAPASTPASASATASRAKFVNFASPTTSALVEKLSSFKKEYPLPNSSKKLVITPLTNDMIDPTADTLTAAFSDSMGYLNNYATFLRRKIGEYLVNHVRMLPKALILIAILEDVDADVPSSTSTATSTGHLVGTVEVSFHPSTRSKHLTLNSPADLPYLCNMAVNEEHKRAGYGSLLLDAAERLVLNTGYKSIYLHVRHVDKPALQLYRKFGYEPEGEDIGLVKLLGMDQRYLMRKYLQPRNED